MIKYNVKYHDPKNMCICKNISKVFKGEESNFRILRFPEFLGSTDSPSERRQLTCYNY